MNSRKIILMTTFFVVLLTSLLPQNIYILVFFSILTLGLLPYRKWWDGVSMGLLMFSIFYSVMVVLSGQMESGFLIISYLISPIALYRFGHYLMNEYRADNERFRLLLCIAFAYLLNVFVLTFIDITVVGIINDDRTLLGTSTEDDALAATLYGLMASVGIGTIGACFTKEQKLMIRLFYFVLVVLSLLIVIHLINRGGLVIFVVCLIGSLLINYKSDFGKLLLVAIALIIGIFVLLNFEIIGDDILEAYQNRNDVEKYGVESAGGRINLWMMSVENLFRNPMGWEQESYAHNLWLDLAKIGGWISLFPFLIVTVIVIRKVLILFQKGDSSFTDAIIVLNLAMCLAAFIEPVIEGSILFFCILMMVWGCITKIYNESSY